MTREPDDAPSASSGGRGGAATRVGVGIFLSRISGFISHRLFAHFFGSSDVADAWRAALRMPNVLQNLLGEGTLSASMIPVYAEFLEQGRDEDARRFAGAALGILAAVAGALVLTGWLLAPILVGVVFSQWGPEKQELVIRLVRILLPMTGILVLFAWALGILNSHRRFFVSYSASVLWNLAMITAMVAGGVYFGLGEVELVIALAWGALVGGVAQFAVTLPFLLRPLGGLRISLGRGVDGVAEAIRNFTPVLAARGVVNLSSWLDMFIAGFLATGALAVVGYAQTFYLLPISLFGMSVAASELPELSRMRTEGYEAITDRVRTALRRVWFFLIPSAVVYLALGDVVVAALFETGSFGETQTLITWGVLAAYSLGLPASASSRVLSSAFYAFRDTRTPARIAYLRVVVSTVVGVAAMIPADTLGFQRLHLGAAGLALGASVGAWLEYVLLRRALGQVAGPHGPGPRPVLMLTLAASLAAATGVAVQVLAPAANPVVTALETLIPFGVVFFAVALAAGEDPGLRRASRG